MMTTMTRMRVSIIYRVMMAMLVVAFLLGDGALAAKKLTLLTYDLRTAKSLNLPNLGEFEDGAIARFEREHPGVKVEVIEAGPEPNLTNKFLAMVAGGVAPDLVVTNAWNNISWIVKGLVRDLTPFIEKNKDFFKDWSPNLLDALKFKGRLYHLPRHGLIGPYIMWYNRALLDQAGLQYPTNDWTLDEFLRMALKLTRDTDGDGKLDQMALTFGWEGWLKWFYNLGGDIIDSDHPHISKIGDETSISAARWINELQYKYKVLNVPGIPAGREGGWQNGKVAFIDSGAFATFDEKPVPERGVVLWPKTARNVTPYTVQVYMISTGSKEPDLAFELLKCLTDESLQIKTTSMVNVSMPVINMKAMREPVVLEAVRKASKDVVNYIPTLNALYTLPFRPVLPPVPTEGMNSLNAALAPMHAGQKPVEEVMISAHKVFQEALSKFWGDSVKK